MTRTAVCVLGMHRSGTSILTRALSLAGVHLGDAAALTPGADDNPDGYYERTELVTFNERLLAVFDRRWADAEPLPDGWDRHPAIERILGELPPLLDAAYPGEPVWGFKDPRACLVLPAWRRVLAARGERLVAIMPVRNPFDIARSLEKRDGFPPGRSLVLWLYYVSTALCAAEGLPVALLSYARFQDDPVGQLRAAFRLLDLPAPPAKVEAELRAVVRPRAGAPPPLEGAPLAVERLYRLLEVPEPALAGAAVLAAARAARAELSAFASAFTGEPAARAAHRHITEVVARAEAGVRVAEARAAEQRAELDRVVSSRSWKVTAPLREAARRARKLAGRE